MLAPEQKKLDDTQLIETAMNYLQIEFGANIKDAEITVHHDPGSHQVMTPESACKLTDDTTLVTATFNGESGIVTAHLTVSDLKHALARKYRTADTQIEAITEPHKDKPANETFSHFIVRF